MVTSGRIRSANTVEPTKAVKPVFDPSVGWLTILMYRSGWCIG
jgi:hypothetical protein